MNIGFSINRRIAALILLTALAITALAGIWLSNRVSRPSPANRRLTPAASTVPCRTTPSTAT